MPPARASVAGMGLCHVVKATLSRLIHNLDSGVAQKQQRPGRGAVLNLNQGVLHAWGQWIGRADTLRARCAHPVTVRVKESVPCFKGFHLHPA